ncbi:DUF4468 domain-containing protein [Roseivirga pacifica]|uniref:DUF4468 domain-containing protein n=1 Tax=Roseivirga pacifica TaxID=1267423 RepID=UPI00209607A8|nr:DUF4468 domain-containing protein [Roseivirga pacifica]MCO6367867.1 DUF4468 domain-containing protein [Roseivirga pacifica]MCO6377239.1 DUF4468 domain-containing protein [Roseivirga pacifica]
MKPLLLAILLFSVTIATAQKATIRKHDGTVADVTIQALSETAIFTNAGNIDLKDLDIISFPKEDPDFERTYTKLRRADVIVIFGSKTVFPEDLTFYSKHPDYPSALPIDENGNFFVEEVVEADGDADELYTRAKLLIVNTFRSANAVIQLDDKENHILIGKGYSGLVVRGSLGNVLFKDLYYTLKIETRDGRFKYSQYDFRMEDDDPDIADIYLDGFFHYNVYYKRYEKFGKQKGPRSIMESYHYSILRKLKTFRISLINQMLTPSKTDDW